MSGLLSLCPDCFLRCELWLLVSGCSFSRCVIRIRPLPVKREHSLLPLLTTWHQGEALCRRERPQGLRRPGTGRGGREWEPGCENSSPGAGAPLQGARQSEHTPMDGEQNTEDPGAPKECSFPKEKWPEIVRC